MARRMKDKDEYKSSRQSSPFCFWHELRCTKTAMPNQKLCLDCSGKIVLCYDKKTHKNQTAWVHGCIDEPIPEWSFIFDGPEFHKRVSKYGAPSEQEMARGKKAQIAARGSDSKVEEITQTLARLSLQEQTNTATASTMEPIQPKPRGKAKKDKVEDKPKVAEDKPKVAEDKPKDDKPKRAAPRKKNTVVQVEPVVPAQAYESTELPLTNVEVVKIQVRKMMIHDKPYFLDAKKYKLYEMNKDKMPGKYIGRWDPQEETMDTSFPDSDQE